MPKRLISGVLAALSVAIVGSCAIPLPPDNICGELRLGENPLAGTERAPIALTPPQRVETQEVEIITMGGVFTRRVAPEKTSPTFAPAPINVALFSAGGQWGAYSAGFMNGWSRNEVDPRPQAFDVVTGVSTGALIAPLVFAGSEYDDALRDLYDGVAESDVLRRRSALELVAATSLWDATPLIEMIDNHLTDELISDIAEGSETRSLLVGAVNLRSGFFEAFDMTAMAASDNPERPLCLREGLMASAAIPAAFRPRLINGDLYIDGGTRQGLFLQGLAAANVNPTIYLFLNSANGFPPEEPVYTLGRVISRSSSIATDELLRSSTIEALLFAKSQGWRVRGAIAPEIWPGPECDVMPNQKAAFCASFTRALFDAGYAQAREGRIDWLSADEMIEILRQQPAATFNQPQ